MTNPDDRREDDFDLAARLLRAAGSREAPPPELEARARAAVEAQWRDRVAAKPTQRRGWTMVALPIAASLAIAAAVALWWTRMDAGSSGSMPAPPPVAAVALVRGDAISIAGDDPATRRALAAGASLAAGSRIETRAGAVVALALDDETSVRIAPESSVVLAARGRLELERGQVYVDHRGERSAEGMGAALEIHTELGVVTEVGTQFEVAVAGGTLRTRVREGVVAFTTGSERYLAAAGSELEWAAPSGAARRQIAPFADVWSWTLEAAPALDLQGWTLDRVLTWVTRETGRQVVFADPALHARLGGERIAGELRIG
ncbi:MAG TPA: FecR family protein, partial [Thermoanaerobaculia bacterium]|nr:FecR family protein [Thermoanaerobaculia bacterium]